jgi:hypothetical protein
MEKGRGWRRKGMEEEGDVFWFFLCAFASLRLCVSFRSAFYRPLTTR